MEQAMNLEVGQSEKEAVREARDRTLLEGLMNHRAEAVYDRAKKSLTVTVTARKSTAEGWAIMPELEVQTCEDPAVCVCVATCRRGEEAKRAQRTAQGESIASVVVPRDQAHEFVVVTNGEAILTACAVKER